MDTSFEPPRYRTKRLVIIIFSSLQIAGTLLLAACSKYISDAFADQLTGSKGSVYEKNKQLYNAIFFVAVIITALMGAKASLLGLSIQIFGLLGALRHSIFLSTMYVIFQILGDLYSIITATSFSVLYWGRLTCSLIVTIVAFLLVRDMKIKRDGEARHAKLL